MYMAALAKTAPSSVYAWQIRSICGRLHFIESMKLERCANIVVPKSSVRKDKNEHEQQPKYNTKKKKNQRREVKSIPRIFANIVMSNAEHILRWLRRSHS